jgi:hypothetical protein
LKVEIDPSPDTCEIPISGTETEVAISCSLATHSFKSCARKPQLKKQLERLFLLHSSKLRNISIYLYNMSAELSHSNNSRSDVESQDNLVVSRTSLVQWIRQNPRKAAGVAFGGVAVLSCIIGLSVGLAGAKSSASNRASSTSGSGSQSAVPAAVVEEYSGSSSSFAVSCDSEGTALSLSDLPSDATCIIRTDTFERAIVSNGVATFPGVTDASAIVFELYTAQSGEFDCSGSLGDATCSN